MWFFEPFVIIKTWCMFGLELVEQGSEDEVRSGWTMERISMILVHNFPCFWDVFVFDVRV